MVPDGDISKRGEYQRRSTVRCTSRLASAMSSLNLALIMLAEGNIVV